MTSPDLQITQLARGEPVPGSATLRAALRELGIKFSELEDQVILTNPLELLEVELIRQQLDPIARDLVSHIKIHWSIGSTNSDLMEQTDRDDFHGSVCLAERQVSGRGRRGRTWVSPFGKNIYLSLGWKMSVKTGGIGGLSLVVGMQVAKSLRSLGLADVGLKWPNDILFNGGKLSGILIEMGTSVKGEIPLVIGIGVNLQLDESDVASIDQPCSAIGDVTEISRNALVSLLISNVLAELERFSGSGFSPYCADWESFNVYHGKPVRVIIGERVIEGVDHGIDEGGNLVLKTSAGLQTFNAGEVTLRAS